MNAVRNRRNVSHVKPRVEVIPMIDIMMFLLIFFVILTLKMIDGTGVSMEIPGSKTTKDIERSTLTIGVDKMGVVVVDGKEVSSEVLSKKLTSLQKENGNIDIILAGDKDTSLQHLISVMDTVRGAGINSVAIAARADRQ